MDILLHKKDSDPCLEIWEMVSNNLRTNLGAKPKEGSSKMRSSGEDMSPFPMPSICLSPPLSVLPIGSSFLQLREEEKIFSKFSNDSSNSSCCRHLSLGFRDGHIRKDASPFGNLAYSKFQDLVRRDVPISFPFHEIDHPISYGGPRSPSRTWFYRLHSTPRQQRFRPSLPSCSRPIRPDCFRKNN